MANVTVLPEDYDGLKKEYLVLRKELDVVNQELYVSKRQLKVVEALQLEYQCEIEILQSEENSQKLKQDEKVAQLEENINNVRSKCNKQIQTLESELSLKDQEIEKLKTEIELLKKTNATQSPADDVYKLLEEEFTNVKLENDILLENEEDLKLSLEMVQKNCDTLEETLTEYKEELINLKESLSCKRDELLEANDLVQKLNDELFCVKGELESFKSKPLNTESKGNSLFAEVDDRRVYLQKTINNMKSEYISMKQERAKHLNLISHLKKENKTLCERWKMDVEEKEDDQLIVIKSYKDQIQILEGLLEKYKKDLAAKPVLISTGTFNEIEFYQIMLNNKLKELEELRDQLKTRGLTHTLLSTALKEANKEIRKWRLDATLKQCQLELQPGDPVSESTLTKKLDETLQEPRIELRQTKRGPHLACRKEEKESETCSDLKKEENTLNCSKEVKEVIVINDSSDDLQIAEARFEPETRQEKPNLGILKHKENETSCEDMETVELKDEETCVKEAPVGCSEDKLGDSEKENVPEKVSRKVTFSQGTVSPKPVDRTALRANCKRIVVPKPIFISSE